MPESTPNREQFRSPGQQSHLYFMGGANAGEVLVMKSPILVFDEPKGQLAQYSFEFLADLNDSGDLGIARNIAAEHDLSVLAQPGTEGVRLGNMPTWRTFTKSDSGLYVSEKSGVLFEHQRDDPDRRGWVLVTPDPALTSDLFREVYETPVNAKGRVIFSKFMKYWQGNADKIELDKPRRL